MAFSLCRERSGLLEIRSQARLRRMQRMHLGSERRDVRVARAAGGVARVARLFRGRGALLRGAQLVSHSSRLTGRLTGCCGRPLRCLCRQLLCLHSSMASLSAAPVGLFGCGVRSSHLQAEDAPR